MAYTDFTIQNLSTTTSATINSILVTDDANILHHSNFSNFGGDFTGDTNNTGNTTVVTKNKSYVTGSPLLKEYDSATFPIDVRYKGHTGTTLIVDSTVGLVSSWVSNSDDDTYDGLYIVTVTSATWLVMSGTPSGTPVFNGNIEFSTSTNELTLQSPDTTSGLGPGWTITGNGYEVVQNAYIISVKDSTTLIVDQLPVNTPTPGNDMIFTSSTNFLTLNNVTDLAVGWSLSGNGYNGTQRIFSIDAGSDTVITDLPPNGFPSVSGGPITFTSDYTLYTLAPLASVMFSMDYTNVTTNVGPSYPSLVTINAIQGAPVVKLINNYVAINATPVSPIFAGRDGGGGGGNFDGGGGGRQPSEGVQGKPGESNMANAGAGLPGGTEGQGPGDGCCFDPFASVTMYDGTFKHIKDIVIGDLVMNQQGRSNTVIDIEMPALKDRLMYSFNDHWAFVSEEHPILTTAGWAAFDPNSWAVEEEFVGLLSKIEVGSEIVTQSGIEIVSKIEQHVLPSDYVIYNLMLDGDHTYIVENCIVHNKKAIVCSAMNEAYGFGSYRNRIWLVYSEKHLTKAHEVGYHAMFLPLVDYAYKQGDGLSHRMLRHVLEHIAKHRSVDLRAEMRGLKRDTVGRIYRTVLEPLCYAIGKIKGY